MIVEGVIKKTIHCVIKEFSETKKSKETQEEFGIILCEDEETGENFKLIISLRAYKELKEGDELFIKYYYAKQDKYDEEKMVLTKGKHGQIMKDEARKK